MIFRAGTLLILSATLLLQVSLTSSKCVELAEYTSTYDINEYQWTVAGYVGTPVKITVATYTPKSPGTEMIDNIQIPWKLNDSFSYTSTIAKGVTKMEVSAYAMTKPENTSDSTSRHTPVEMNPTPINVTRVGNSTDGYELFAVKWPAVNRTGGGSIDKFIIGDIMYYPDSTACSWNAINETENQWYEIYVVMWTNITQETTTAEMSTSSAANEMETTTSNGQRFDISIIVLMIFGILPASIRENLHG